MSIDKRKNYYLVFDTETTGTLEEPLVYDIGGAIIDKQGKVYESFSFVVDEIFNNGTLMATAYYGEKIPAYEQEISDGSRIVSDYSSIRTYIKDLCDKYEVKALMAHNAYFDYKATSNTRTVLEGYKTFLPWGYEIWDTLKMARDTIGKQKSYVRWCNDNGYLNMYGKPQLKAEILYRYISGDNEFIESHTGLEDVMIEKEIFRQCLRQHKPMRKKLFKDRT